MESIDNNIFDQGQKCIKELMATDSYPRFIKSSKYRSLLA
ncbi:hypothetical protein TrispH2_003115 [Trichoplax sp. H2]|nr:hypothetical protein TrispH2_003115 [Trichoplax sp. H2]|eukprot:RDD44410.1 hypothetical protein TrispH2_003115 [Trichoplax sp. H2]